MSNIDNEPSNDKIEDYNGQESREKRNTVRLSNSSLSSSCRWRSRVY